MMDAAHEYLKAFDAHEQAKEDAAWASRKKNTFKLMLIASGLLIALVAIVIVSIGTLPRAGIDYEKRSVLSEQATRKQLAQEAKVLATYSEQAELAQLIDDTGRQ